MDHIGVSKNTEKFSGLVIPIPRKSIWSIYHVKTSRWVFFTHGLSLSLINRKDQISINVWHGTPIKRIGFSDGKMIQNSTYLTMDPNFEIAYEGMFSPNPPHPQSLPFGLPRNEFLRAAVLGELKTRKLIWLPTYRQSALEDQRMDGTPGQYGFGVDKSDLLQIDKELRDLKVFLDIKFHPMSNCSLPDIFTNIKIFDDGSDSRMLYEKLNDYDALISDYSSVILDFTYTKKEIFIFAPDKRKYQSSRGFTFDFGEVIDAKNCSDVNALISNVREIYSHETVHSLNNSMIEGSPTSSMLFTFLLGLEGVGSD